MTKVILKLKPQIMKLRKKEFLFKESVKRLKLKGFTFQYLWSGTSSGRSINEKSQKKKTWLKKKGLFMRVLFNEVRNPPTAVSGEKCRVLEGESFWKEASYSGSRPCGGCWSFRVKSCAPPWCLGEICPNTRWEQHMKRLQNLLLFPANHTQCGIFKVLL